MATYGKNNVVTRSSEANITAGYQANVIGFGWTMEFLELLHALPANFVDQLAKEQQERKVAIFHLIVRSVVSRSRSGTGIPPRWRRYPGTHPVGIFPDLP